MAKTTFIKIALLVALIILVGCSTPKPIVIRKTIEVEVPVYTPIEPPDYLLKPVVITGLPVFYNKTEIGVTSCLKPDDELKFKQTVFLLLARINEWMAFAGH